MKVFVTSRQGGKTQALVEWLLAGEPIPHSPGWSRVVVCASQEAVVHVSRRVFAHVYRSNPGVKPEELHRVRQAIWGFGHLSSISIGLRGHGDFEVAVDNADLILANILYRVPTIVTMTGELYERPTGPPSGD